MKASQLRELIRELIQNHMDEMSTTGALVQFGGTQVTDPRAFAPSMRDWKKINKNRKWESINENEDEYDLAEKMQDKALKLLQQKYAKSGNELYNFIALSERGFSENPSKNGEKSTIISAQRKNRSEAKFKVFYNNQGEITKIDHIYNPISDTMGDLSLSPKDLKLQDSNLNESYRKFKKKITNPRQQMNNSVREIEKHLREVDKIIEYNLKLKTEMNVGGGTFYEGTNKRLARISERMNQLNNKLKELGN